MSDPVTLDEDGELVALRELVASPGWRCLVTMANGRYSAGQVLERIANAAGDPSGDAYAVIKQLAARDAIAELMHYPGARIAALEKRAEDEAHRPIVPSRA